MATNESTPSSLVVRRGQVLVAVPDLEEGEEVTRYFIEGDQHDTSLVDEAIADARSLAGAWSDLDWDEMEAELDRIRHESKPTPLIDFLSRLPV
jgi:hypothetical protein